MPITRDVDIDERSSDRINVLARTIVTTLNGQQKTHCELALLLAYCNVADGVQHMPANTRNARTAMIVSKASRALCDIIEEVSAIDDGQFMQHQFMAPTCRE